MSPQGKRKKENLTNYQNSKTSKKQEKQVQRLTTIFLINKNNYSYLLKLFQLISNIDPARRADRP